MLQVPLPARDVYNIILRTLNIFTDFFEFVINRCWYIITSYLDNFPSKIVWITSSVSIVYEQLSFVACQCFTFVNLMVAASSSSSEPFPSSFRFVITTLKFITAFATRFFIGWMCTCATVCSFTKWRPISLTIWDPCFFLFNCRFRFLWFPRWCLLY